MFNFFKKKSGAKPKSLEEVRRLGLITEEEILRLEIQRRQAKLKTLAKKKSKRKKGR